MNQRVVFFIAKKVAVDLPGHREMHVRRAFLPVVAPSRRVPVHLNAQRGGSTPPPTLTGVKQIYSLDSGDFRRHVVFYPARILCVAGYFRCIGAVPVHVFSINRKDRFLYLPVISPIKEKQYATTSYTRAANSIWHAAA